MSRVVPAKPKSTFKQIHELAKTAKSLKRISQKMIDYLESVVDDKEADPKLKAQCAQTLLKLYMDVAKEVNSDKLNRLILEVKATGLIGQGSTADDDDDTPALDFDNIHPQFRDVEDAQNVVDMSDINKIG